MGLSNIFTGASGAYKQGTIPSPDILEDYITGGSATAKYNTDATNLANMKMQAYAYSKDLETWNRMNDYNSPKNQMKRFAEAGLNPNLMYGKGETGNATTLPKYNAPTLQYNYQPPVVRRLGEFQDMAMKQAQIDNVKVQNKILNADAIIKESDARFRDSFNTVNLSSKDTQNMIQQFKMYTDGQTFNSLFWLNNGNYVPKHPEIFNKAVWSDKEIKIQELKKYQQEVSKLEIENKLKGKEYEFLESGGKYFQPILQFLRMFRGN